MKTINTLRWFRKIALAEGVSFIILLGIAMPLKYLADMPLAVRITGMLHGILFVAFVIMAWETMGSLNKNYRWFLRAMLASVIPFGTFVLDRELKKEEELISL